jgi:hypothetical protein
VSMMLPLLRSHLETTAWREVAAMVLCDMNHSATIVLCLCFYGGNTNPLFLFDDNDPQKRHLPMQHTVSHVS